jgi:glycosyltransferase involved in cell wall biosynthesis
MRLLFVTKPHLPTRGGAQLTTHHLAVALAQGGHDVLVLAQERRPNEWPSPAGRAAEYPVVASPRPHTDLPRLLRSFRPDATVVGSYGSSSREWTRAVLRASATVPAVLYLHDVANVELCVEEAQGIDLVIGVSDFVGTVCAANRVRAFTVPPIVDRSDYSVPTSRRVVLFVSPTPNKGLATARRLAAVRSDVEFVFRHCSHVPRDAPSLLDASTLPANVTVGDPVHSPGELYGEAGLALVPSVYPEAFGRVAAEAQSSGIPVLASDIGGLPEATGDGGMLVPPAADASAWVEAFGRMWDDAAAYASYARRADSRSRSGAFSASATLARFESLVAPVAVRGLRPDAIRAVAGGRVGVARGAPLPSGE